MIRICTFRIVVVSVEIDEIARPFLKLASVRESGKTSLCGMAGRRRRRIAETLCFEGISVKRLAHLQYPRTPADSEVWHSLDEVRRETSTGAIGSFSASCHARSSQLGT